MKVAVWDTYVRRHDGNVLHFDIIVPESIKNEKIIFEYGKNYLSDIGESKGELSTSECRFCHMEEPSDEITDSIKNKGYFILEMEEIPAELAVNPSRREMILYLRGHYSQYRFSDFKNKSTEEIQEILKQLQHQGF